MDRCHRCRAECAGSTPEGRPAGWTDRQPARTDLTGPSRPSGSHPGSPLAACCLVPGPDDQRSSCWFLRACGVALAGKADVDPTTARVVVRFSQLVAGLVECDGLQRSTGK